MSDIFDIFKKIEKKEQAPSNLGPIEFIVVGLGNPDKKYEGTRHNVGFSTVDYISNKRDFKIDKIKFKGVVGEKVINSHRVLFLKPSTYMNLSGQSVIEAMNFYKVPIENVIVIFDDISLEPGKIRIKRKGSDGGHNGIKNIIYLSESDNFPRIKIGVGAKPNPEYDLAAWVLGKPDSEDREKIESAIISVNNALELILDNKIEEAMSKFN